MQNRTTSLGPGFERLTGDEFIPRTVPMLSGPDRTTWAAGAIQTSIIASNSRGSKFACIELLDGNNQGLHFLLTPDGARSVADGLIRIAADIDADLAGEASKLLDRITAERGGHDQ